MIPCDYKLVRGAFQGRGGLTPPLDQWNLLISGGFQAPTCAEPLLNTPLPLVPFFAKSLNKYLKDYLQYNSFLTLGLYYFKSLRSSLKSYPLRVTLYLLYNCVHFHRHKLFCTDKRLLIFIYQKNWLLLSQDLFGHSIKCHKKYGPGSLSHFAVVSCKQTKMQKSQPSYAVFDVHINTMKTTFDFNFYQAFKTAIGCT